MNVLNGNTWYVDTAHVSNSDDLVRKQALVVYIIVTATASNGRIVLGDVGANPDIKLDLRVATSGESRIFSFPEKPINFPNGIRAITVTNAVATVIVSNPGG